MHEGVNGDNCWSKLPGHGATNGSGYTTSPIDGIFGVGMPLHGVDVVIVALGTNPEDGGTFPVNYLNLVRQIHTLELQARFVGVQIIPNGGVTVTNNTTLTSAGGSWDTLMADGIPIFRTTPMTGISLSGDAIHPDAAGYASMGAIIGPALNRALSGRF